MSSVQTPTAETDQDGGPLMHRPSSNAASPGSGGKAVRRSSVTFGAQMASGEYTPAPPSSATTTTRRHSTSGGKIKTKDDDDDDNNNREDIEEMITRGTSGTGCSDPPGDDEEGQVRVTSFKGKNSASALKRQGSLRYGSPRNGSGGALSDLRRASDATGSARDSGGGGGSGAFDGDDGGANAGVITGTKGIAAMKRAYKDMTAAEFSFSHRCFNIIHGDPVVSPDDIIASVYHTILICAIVLSIVILIVSSDVMFKQGSENAVIDTSDPFFICEAVSVALFTVDAILQLATAEQWADVFHMQFAFDVVSVLGFYLELGIGATGTAALVIFRIFRLTRVLRVLKVSSAANAMNLIIRTLYNSNQGMIMLVSLISVVTLLGASVVYFLDLQYSRFDDRSRQWYWDNGELSPFQSVPETFWFVIATITTIGYGDIVPYSIVAKSATLMLMLFGVLLLSFPNILIGAQFQLLHRNFQRDRARHRLGVMFRRARMLMRFVRLWREYSVRGTINELLEDNPLLEIPQEDEDMEGELNLYDDDEEEEEQDEEGAEYSKAKEEQIERYKRKVEDVFDVVNLLHIPEHMKRRHRHYVNFWFYPGEYPAVDFTPSERVLGLGHFDRFWVGGAESGGSKFSALHLTQRLLENFSGCATADELFESFALYPPYGGAAIRRSDVVLMLLNLAATRNVMLFVLSRTEETYVVAFSRVGLGIIRTFPETGLVTCPCFRSLEQASSIWRRTTRKPLPLDSPFGFDGYPKWQVAQALVPPVDVINFTENLRLTHSKRNHVVFLKSGFQPITALWTAASPPFPTSFSGGGVANGGANSSNNNNPAMLSPKQQNITASHSASFSHTNNNNNNNNTNSNNNNNNNNLGNATPDNSAHFPHPRAASSAAAANGLTPPTAPNAMSSVMMGSSNYNAISAEPSYSAKHEMQCSGNCVALKNATTESFSYFAGGVQGGAGAGGAAPTLGVASNSNFAAAVPGRCKHCVHCMSQAAIVPVQVPDSMWKAKQEKALSDFVWKTDEAALEMQVEYLQNWIKIIKACKKNPRLVKKPDGKS